jgi:BetR domain
MDSSEVQLQFFNYLKSILPRHVSLVDALTDILNLSQDSVYRRIRGETPLPLEELKLLCEKYHISLDQVLHLRNNTIVFQDASMDNEENDFGTYLNGLIEQLKYLNGFGKKEMFYLCKDLPIFCFFHFRELASFKIFFWVKSIFNHPDYSRKSFSIAAYPYDEYFVLGQHIIKLYNEMPSVEIVNLESITSTIRQIEFYRDAGVFESKADLISVVNSLDLLLQHMEKQAEHGQKFVYGAGEAGYKSSLKFYINDVILGNNSILFEVDGKRVSFINHIVLHYLMTTDDRFCNRAFQNFRTLLARSTMISQTGEKERTRFFKTLRERVRLCANWTS